MLQGKAGWGVLRLLLCYSPPHCDGFHCVIESKCSAGHCPTREKYEFGVEETVETPYFYSKKSRAWAYNHCLSHSTISVFWCSFKMS